MKPADVIRQVAQFVQANEERRVQFSRDSTEPGADADWASAVEAHDAAIIALLALPAAELDLMAERLTDLEDYIMKCRHDPRYMGEMFGAASALIEE